MQKIIYNLHSLLPKPNIFSIIFLIILINSHCFSLDTVSTKFLPMKVGNIWVYEWYYFHPPFPTDSGATKVVMLRDTTANGHKYYYFRGVPDAGPLSIYVQQWIRFDSTTGNILGLAPQYNCSYHPGEILIDSLASRKYDTAKACSYPLRICKDTGSINICAIQTAKKDFYTDPLSCSCLYYAKNLGIYGSSNGELQSRGYSLKGCVINGIVYGDTNFTAIHSSQSEVPVSYQLFQNYPNPFNPSTKIKYTIAKSGDVMLKIFDVLGKEVNTLVSKKQRPGTYEADWDGTYYTSGVYFYKLTSGDFSETKSMVLLK
jgi:hypothetical protein